MKKNLLLLLALVLCFSLFACKNNETSPDTQGSTGTTESGPAANTAEYYVGEWKANVKVSSEGDYEIYTIKLNEDGTGSYRDHAGTWEYYEAGNMIVLTTSSGIAALEIGEKGGKTVLNFYDAVYYRANEFEG